jgi:hypothetical protein
MLRCGATGAGKIIDRPDSGRLWVEVGSAPGEGSVFSVTIPLAGKEGAA